MANKRIYDLTENASPAAGDYLPLDKSGNAEALKVDVGKFVLASGAITGAASQAQVFTVGVSLPTSTSGTAGVVFKATDRFLHDYHAAGSDGHNTFVGVEAGNFSLGPGGGTATLGSRNVGVGWRSLYSLTTGRNNTAVGDTALAVATSAQFCTGIGQGALVSDTDGYANTALGYLALASQAGGSNAQGYNTAIGVEAMYSHQSGPRNTALGYCAGRNNVTGEFNVFVGQQAGMYETGSYKLFVDNTDRTDEATGRISALIYGEFNATVGSQLLRVNGVQQTRITDSATNAKTTLHKLTHNTSGTVAAGFGIRTALQLESSTTEDTDAAYIDAAWVDPTHATRTSYVALHALYNGTMYPILHNYHGAGSNGLNIFLGPDAGNFTNGTGGGAAIYGSANMGIGNSSLRSLTTGFYNAAVGPTTMMALTTGALNTAIGMSALQTNVSGNANTAVGCYALQQVTAELNTAVGYYALYSAGATANSVALGAYAGKYETAGNKLFIDGLDRSTEAAGRTNSLIYGEFNSTVASQKLAFNCGYMGFFGTAAQAKPTGVAVTAEGIHAALVTLGLIAA